MLRALNKVRHFLSLLSFLLFFFWILIVLLDSFQTYVISVDSTAKRVKFDLFSAYARIAAAATACLCLNSVFPSCLSDVENVFGAFRGWLSTLEGWIYEIWMIIPIPSEHFNLSSNDLCALSISSHS
ncbi:hypothetical protein CPB84DRAFT_1785801 [Gymnopilus junonius]|uniref:Uncharacterized protein n=1 Tax=Gymnopilus junonius TaxID=109634 RepID=A0A9P5NI06_GYMJU|nr:hypothetical protein CPB84DRAFT_1785801 [Gymnopilus junonius]